MTSVIRYLVIADYQRSTTSVLVGTRAYVLFVTRGGDVAVVVRGRAGHAIQQTEDIAKLANYRIKRVTEDTCPSNAWRWARPTREDCAQLVARCKELRAERRDAVSSREDE